MIDSVFTRMGRHAFLPWAAGASWLFAGLVSLARDEPTHTLDAWMLLPLTLTYLLLGRLAAESWAVLPRYGRVGTALVALSFPPMLLGQLAALFSWDAIAWLGFPVGLLVWMAGCGLLGVALARSGLSPRAIGYGIAHAQPAAILTGIALSPIRELSDYGSYTGALAHGVIWLGIAHAVRQRAPAAGMLSAEVGAPA
jgi:hypothetical protein